MKMMFCLMMALVVGMLLTGVSDAMAGAYDTGEGHGYASCSGTEIVPNGTIFHVVQIQPDVYPKLYNGIDLIQSAVLFRFVFRPVAYYLPVI